jgi:tetratricopeptide (TPR) repeat protein
MAQRSGADIERMVHAALALHRQGQLREAEKLYSRVLKFAPDQFDSLNLLGTIKAQRGEIGEAYRLIRAALKINPRAADAWTNLGNVLHSLKRDQEALESFERSLALNPADADTLNHRGSALLSLARPADALAAFDQVLAILPRHGDARINRGIALAALTRHEEALAELDAALSLMPGHPIAHYNRGIALFNLGRYREAIAAYDTTLAALPDHAQAWNNRGYALAALNRTGEALASYDRAIAIRKDYADAHFNRALALLLTGDLRRGFEQYEWRWRRSGMPPQRGPGRPLWLGEYPLQRKAILLQAEQGLGDTIQFARYVPMLARAGAAVMLEVQSALKPLLASIEGAAAVVARGEALPAFDVHCPLGSLPLALRTEPTTIPAATPYLVPDPARLAKWRARLDPVARPRVAIAWLGSAAHPNDRNRSLPFARLAPILSAPARFIAIQRDLRPEESAALAADARVLHLGEELDDFADTAAVAALADLIISVDTSTAHLAGALARPTWILLPFAPDWRWGLQGDLSAWYPTARLFRQPAPGDWDGVIAEVAAALARLPASDQEQTG